MKHIIPLLMIAACSTIRMEQDPRNVPKSAPKDYRPVGIISYLSTGLPSIVKSRRDKVFDEMRSACGGEYEIIREGDQIAAVTVNPNGFGGHNVSSINRKYIHFNCKEVIADK